MHTSDSNHQEMFINNYEADLTDAYGTLPPSSCHDKLYGCHGNCLNNSGDLILCHIIIWHKNQKGSPILFMGQDDAARAHTLDQAKWFSGYWLENN